MPRFFTHFCGVTFWDWCRTLQANRFAISPRFWRRAVRVTAGSVVNSFYRRREDRAFGDRIDRTRVPGPVFILGHWRSGTTLLHNLFARDRRFAFPTLYEVLFPHTFLLTEDRPTRLAKMLTPRIKPTRGVDNMAMGLDLPSEDEFATATASLLSPYLTWAFPRSGERYERYLTFRGVGDDEVAHWKAVFLRFLKKLTLRHGRPLVLKSPPHTGRIRILLDLFPDARFVHVHRHPHVVFQSTRRLNDALVETFQFQKAPPADPDEWIIRRYRAMHDAYFDERGLIPDGHLHEVAFADLERDLVGRMRIVYESLGLPDFGVALPRMERYAADLRGYRKNTYPELPSEMKARLHAAWERSFDEWHYPST